jgi:hypothetical protein
MSTKLRAKALSKRVRSQRAPSCDYIAHPFQSPKKILNDSEYKQRVMSVVHKPELKQILDVIIDLGLLTPDEIAAEVGVSVDVIKDRLSELKLMLGDVAFEHYSK